MRRTIIAMLAFLFLAGNLRGQERVLTDITFVPQWTAQSQFAGFYLALEKGFYEEEGLNVTIDHIKQNSTENPLDKLLKGDAQIVGQQLLQSVIARSDGKPIVNVMQITEVSGLWCVGRNPIGKPEDLDGLKVGKWRVGYSEFCDIMEVSKGIKVNWVPFINGINLMIFGAVDAILCYSFSEYISLLLSVGRIEEDHVIKFSEFGYDCPEDGLYVTEDYYRDNKDAVDAFVRASKRGWEYARNNQEEALQLTSKYIEQENIVTNRVHQKMMLEEYLRLQVNPNSGEVDFAPVRENILNDINGALLGTGYIIKAVEYNEFIR